MKNDFFRIVTKVHAVQNHISFQLHIVSGVGGFVKMLPCPASCTFFGFHQLSVFFFCIYQRDISVILFGRLIHQSEDSFRTGKSHYNAVKLLADLVNGHVEAFVKGKKAGKTSQCKTSISVDGKYSSENSAEYVADISDLCYCWHQNVGKTVGIVGAFKKLII